MRLRAECGEKIRVVGPEAVASYEATHPLPELVTLGEQKLYQVLYDDDGVSDGAVSFTDPEIVEHWTSFIRELFIQGEDLAPFFTRKIAAMPPPVGNCREPVRAHHR
ncbi:hypothetical protein GCM10010160_57590 [Acrocarpospora corrugata]|uniref:DUF6879 family protein n=1 Tax=Acrocarpospora corrugata TaxID=35763 RepID=UPI0012D2FC2E